MDQPRVLEIKKRIFAGNDQRAAVLREELKTDRVFLLNLMSSPGSGKTSTVLRTIGALKDEMGIGVLEADMASDVDARAIGATGTKVVQLHTGGMCHLDAAMIRQGLIELGTTGVDLVILENVGNLVCPAEFDTGAARNAMILSVPEGHDKPLKYPLIFSMVDVLLINKVDALEHFDFDLRAVTERVRQMNPKIQVFPISAKTGQGIAAWAGWLRAQVRAWSGQENAARGNAVRLEVS